MVPLYVMFDEVSEFIKQVKILLDKFAVYETLLILVDVKSGTLLFSTKLKPSSHVIENLAAQKPGLLPIFILTSNSLSLSTFTDSISKNGFEFHTI